MLKSLETEYFQVKTVVGTLTGSSDWQRWNRQRLLGFKRLKQ